MTRHLVGVSLGALLAATGYGVFFGEAARVTARTPGSNLPALGTLAPGAFHTITQRLPINIVFVGYEQGYGPRDIDQARLRAQLADRYCTKKRFPAFYGLTQLVGNCFDYKYNIVYADQAFEDAFFAQLTSLATEDPLNPRTIQQNAYNRQLVRSRNIGQNHRIDGQEVEAWLVQHAPAIGVDPKEYTVFLINWFGRGDFIDHVYVYTAEPDPDTGVSFGIRSSRAMIAWGGTGPKRIWFYDLSAGPEFWTANWNLMVGDLDGNGVVDYRMPPVWEYGNLTGYRPFDDLSGDLGKVVRYVALNLLFTTSPLYDPALSPPKLPGEIQIDHSVFLGNAVPPGATILNPDFVAQRVGGLIPLHTVTADSTTYSLFGRAEKVFTCFAGAFFGGDSCFGRRLFNISFADLFLYFYRDHLLQYLEGDAHYEVPIFAFFSDTLDPVGLLGFADDNWADGTQTYIMAVSSPLLRTFGFGFTTTAIHEVGHHLGISHPHDGYDYETDTDYESSDEFFFAWSGDESRTVMHYLSTTTQFSQFDRDNMNRYLTSTYINHANQILALIGESPRAQWVAAELLAADAEAAQSLAEYEAMDYAAAASDAKKAYERVLAAAVAINVQIEPQAWQADYKAKGRSLKFVDLVDERRLAD